MTGATYHIVVVEGFIVFLLNLSPRGCWRAVGTQCEPVGSECEPARSDSVTECEPGKGDVCKPACGYLRAASATRGRIGQVSQRERR
jgi:hypothetical protein